jgi:hypothetical protein
MTDRKMANRMFLFYSLSRTNAMLRELLLVFIAVYLQQQTVTTVNIIKFE